MTPGRLLVTGATGAIGGAVLRHLHGLEWNEIRVLVHRADPPPGPWTLVRGNLESDSSLVSALSGIDVVLHLAGRGHAHHAEEYWRINANGTRVLLDAAEVAGIGRIVLVSSLASGSMGGAYASSKAEAEEMVKRGPIPWSILRPAEIYGKGAGGFVNRVVEGVSRWGAMPMPGDGSQLLAPVHLEDVSAAIIAALVSDEALGRRLVLAGPDVVSVRELIQRAARAAGRRAVAFPVPWWAMRAAARVARWVGSEALVEDQIERLRSIKPTDFSEAGKILAFRPRGLDEGLRDLVSSLRETGSL